MSPKTYLNLVGTSFCLLAACGVAQAANRFVSNDGTWKMKDEQGQDMEGTCYTSLKSALANGHVIYVKNDYDCTVDTPSGGARYSFGGGYSSCIVRSESGDWRTGPTLSGGHDSGTETGIGANGFRVIMKTGINSYGIEFIGFKLLNGAATETSGDNGKGGCVRGWGAAGRVMLKNCLVSGGAANEGGGAYRCGIENCIVSNNYAYSDGGGLHTSSTVLSTLVAENTVRKSGGGAYGGSFSNCVVACNKSGLAGGMEGGGLYKSTAHHCTITNNISYGQSGGGCRDCTTYNCYIAYNTVVSGTASSVGRGGGGVLGGEHYNDLIAHNICGCYGSGAMQAALYNCTIVDNVGTNADGHTSVISQSGGGYSSVYNCIVWGNRNKSGNLVGVDASVVSNSCIEATSMSEKWGDCTNENPRFVNVLAGDYHPRAKVCRNSALAFDWMTDPADIRSKDLAGLDRIIGDKPDMGCYETKPMGLMLLFR